MRKFNIWLLICVMIATFTVLIITQLSYMRSMMRIQTEQLDNAVHRSLSRVVYLLEQDETQRYLENELEERERQMMQLRSASGRWTMHHEIVGYSLNDTVVPQFFIQQSITRHWGAPVPRNFSLDNKEDVQILKDRYLHQQRMLNDVILRVLYEANERPIEQRVDFDVLEKYLTQEFSRNGLADMPFFFTVRDGYGRNVYASQNYYDSGQRPHYRQNLFMNDPGDQYATLNVFFPTRKGYISDPVKVFIPMIAFTVLLLFVFTYISITLLQQKRLSDMKTDFVNNMTHELKTPVSSILLASQMLRDSDVAKTPDVMKHITGVISDESKRLNFLVEKVLQMSLIERKHQTMKFREIDVNETLDVVTGTFRLKVGKYDGTLETDLAAKEKMVLADEMHFTNVIFNLLDNAVKYRDPDRPLKLKVSSRNEHGRMVISVSDNGIGIKKENINKIFDRFYRVTKGNLHDVKGFGLGLAYVKEIVSDFHGTISVESEIGQGTTFNINLPIIKSEEL